MDSFAAIAVAVLGYVVYLLTTMLHEVGHALMARLIGEREAYIHGKITLNPLAHLSRARLGLGIMPLISLVANMRIGGAWTFGYSAAPFEPEWAVKNRVKAAWIAFGGPAMNLIIALAAAGAIKAGVAAGVFSYDFSATHWLLVKAAQPVPDAAAAMLSMLFYANVLMAAFNIMPLPPLDGFSLMLIWLKPETVLNAYGWEGKLSFLYPLAVYHATAVFWVAMSRFYVWSLGLLF